MMPAGQGRIYDSHDAERLKNFILQADESGKKNYEILGIGEYANDIGVNEKWLAALALKNCVSWQEKDAQPGKLIAVRGLTNTVGVLDLSGCEALAEINPDGSWIKTLNLAGCISLPPTFVMSNTYVDSLDISGTHIETLTVTQNQLRYLNVSGCLRLRTLTCRENRLESLEIKNCPQLTQLTCNEHYRLESLTILSCPQLTRLSCDRNRLVSLDMAGCSRLKSLDCSHNQLGTLDISQNTVLENLDCSANSISSLDISQNTRLKTLNCASNVLTRLSAATNRELESLDCRNNYLSFSTLPERQTNVSYYYAPQGNQTASTNTEGIVDLSRHIIKAKPTSFKWLDDILEVVPADRPVETKSGIFRLQPLHGNRQLSCLITNEAFPGLTIRCEVKTGDIAVGAEPAPAREALRVYAAAEAVEVRVDKPSTLSVYTLSGALSVRQQIPSGLTRIPLPAGYYIVQANGHTAKIRIGAGD
jgi:hypothetical protein